MTTQPTPRTSHLHKIRVPHLRRGLIAAKVGIARKRDRFPLPTPKPRHPERSSLRTWQAAQSKDPDTLHLNKIARTLSTENAFALAFAFAVALASEIGPGFSPDIPGPVTKPGFSPRDMLSSPIHNSITKVAA